MKPQFRDSTVYGIVLCGKGSRYEYGSSGEMKSNMGGMKRQRNTSSATLSTTKHA
jgi:hypothetical protein